MLHNTPTTLPHIIVRRYNIGKYHESPSTIMDVVSKGQHRNIADGLRWNKLLSPEDADVLDYVYGWDIRAIMTSMRFDDEKFAKYYRLVIDYDHFGCIINERSLVRIYTITRDAEFALRLASMYHFPKEKDQNLITILNRNQRID